MFTLTTTVFVLISVLVTGTSAVTNVTVCLESGRGTFTASLSQCGSSVVAYANFSNAINTTGWSYLEVVTSSSFTNEQQAYAAGLAEGTATRRLIQLHWYNTVNGYCNGARAYCERLENYLTKNLQWITVQIAKNAKDPYWIQAKLALFQLAGLEDAYYNKQPKQPHLNIDPFRLLMFQISGELEDLEQKFNKPKHLRRKVMGSGSCSAFIKPVGNDLWFAHDTWSGYNTMLRIQKMYNFAYSSSEEPDSVKIPGNTLTMSSYPGTLISLDDFYLISSGLAVTETTIGNSNSSLLKHITPMDSVQAWIRTSIANRLGTSAQQWAKYFSRFNSGTYNNQWMIVDYKLFNPGHPPPSKGLFRVLEQLPGFIESTDLTKVLTQQGYWPSYNVPYYPMVFNMSGGLDKVKKYGDWFTYDKTPRAKIFKRQWRSVKDKATLINLMRYNNFKKDPLSRCNCTPPYSGENAIAARSDLNPKNGTYPFASLGHRCHGATDMKATNYNLFKKFQFIAIYGPTHQSLPPFQWSKTDCAQTQRHKGHPDSFQYGPSLHSWSNLGLD